MENNMAVPQPEHKGLRTTLIGIVFSIFLALLKGIGGILGNSYALIADAIESTADIFSSAMLWLGLRWAAKPADEEHPYGHGKAEALVSVGIALAMLVAAVIIVIESIDKIRTPHKTPAAYTLIILAIVVVVKELLYRFVLKTGQEIESGAVKADATHHRSDALTSGAAFIGITIGLIGGKGYEMADDWAAMLAAVVIAYNAYKIFRPAVGELLDENLTPELNKKIFELASHTQGVVNVEKCHTRKMGTFNHADLHIRVQGDLSVRLGHDIAHAVKANIQKDLPSFVDVMIHVEPA
jgi:cation diffusion facilitator family transporter